MSAKTYLGDGVYVEFIDRCVKLTAEDGVEVTDTIYLEDEVIQALLRYLRIES